MAADPAVVADHDGLRRIDVGHLQHDRSVAEREPGFGKLRAAHVHLLPDARVFTDLDLLAGHVGHRADAGMAADAYPSPLDNGEQPDLDVVAHLDVIPDDHPAQGDTDMSPDAVTE